MSWKKNNSIDPWDKQIDKQISSQESQNHTDVARKLNKNEKIRRIIFYTLGAVIPLSIITFVFAYKKIKEPLKFWDSSLKWVLSDEAKYDKIVNTNGILSWNKNIIFDSKPEEIMTALFLNPTIDNEILKPLNLKLRDSKYCARISNLILDAYEKKSLHFDIEILTKEKKPKTQFIIRNFTIKTTKEVTIFSNDKINKYNNQSNIKNILSSIKSWKLNFTSSSVYDHADLANPSRMEINKIVNNLNQNISETNYVDRAIKLINYQNNSNYFFNLFHDIKKPFFVPFIFKGNVQFLAEQTPKIKFDANIFSLAKDIMKIKGKKYEYGIYIPYELSKPQKIILPIVFKTVK